jgi:hypothetical protein
MHQAMQGEDVRVAAEPAVLKKVPTCVLKLLVLQYENPSPDHFVQVAASRLSVHLACQTESLIDDDIATRLAALDREAVELEVGPSVFGRSARNHGVP